MKNVLKGLILACTVTLYGSEYQKLCSLVSANDVVSLEPLILDEKIMELTNDKNQTLLFCVAKTGADKSAKLLLEKGMNPNIKDIENRTVLEYLIDEERLSQYPSREKKIHNFIQTALFLVKFGADTNRMSELGGSLLMRTDSPAIIRLLLAYGADIHVKDKYGRNALLDFAGRVGLSDEKRVQILKILLENGADLESKDNEGKDFLQYLKDDSKYTFFKHTHYPKKLENEKLKEFLENAIKEYDYETIEVLLKMENVANDTGYYNKPFAFDALDNSKTLEIFFKYGLDVNMKYQTSTLLEEAIKKCAVESVRLILKHQPKEFNNFQTVAKVINCKEDNRSIEIADILLSEKVSISNTDKFGHTLLHMAAKKSRNKLCEYFLNKGINVDIKDKEGATPIFYALIYGENDECAKTLLDRGANPHQKGSNDVNLLHAGVKGNHIEVVKLLLDKDLDPNETDSEGHNALQLAAKNGNLDMVKILQEKGANLKSVDNDGDSILHYAVKSRDALKYLLAQGIDVDVKNKKGQTALFNAVKGENLDVILYLIDNKANLNMQDDEGNTPLHLAVMGYNKKIIVLLLLRGADKTIVNKEGLSVIQLAEKKYNSDDEYRRILNGEYQSYLLKDESIFDFKTREDVVLYVANGGNMAVTNDNNQSLLDVAQINKNEDMVNYLVSLGLKPPEVHIIKKDLNALDEVGNTPLMNCAVHNDFENAKALIESGAMIDIQDKRGRTALYLTTIHKSYETAEILLNSSANFSLKTNVGHAPLHNAVYEGDDKMVSLLLKFNADPNIVDSRNDTPLHRAVLDGNELIVKLLLDKKADPYYANDVGLSPLDYGKNLKMKNIITLFESIEKVQNHVDSQNTVHVEAEKVPESTMVTSASPTDNKYMQSTLHQAVASQNIDEVKAMLNNNPVDVVDRLGRTPLHYAAISGHVEIARLLLEKGANINALDTTKQWTPLFFAVFMKHQNMVDLLKEKGADETVKDKFNRTANDYREN